MATTVKMVTVYVNMTGNGTEEPVNYVGASIMGLFLATSLICDILLMYITICHGFGSKILDTLVFNWAIFTCIYAIAHSGMNAIYQSWTHHQWGLGLPMCMVNNFLENFCLLPMDVLPSLICLVLFLEVFPNKAGILGKLLEVRPFVWITLGLWLWACDCVFGSFYRGKLSETEFTDTGEKIHFCAISPIIYNSVVEFVFEFMLGALIPLVVIIIVGVLTVRNTKETGGNVLSPLSHKLKIRQLILAIMGIMIIHYFFYTIGFVLILIFIEPSEAVTRSSTIMTISISLALLCCHLEFRRSLTKKKNGAEDEARVLSNIPDAETDSQADGCA